MKGRHLIVFLTALLLSNTLLATGNDDTTRAINRAIDNLKSKGNNVLPTMVPTLNYVIGAYKLDIDIDAQKKDIIKRAFGDEKIFLHALDTAIKAPKNQLENLTGTDKVIATAMYCDCYGLPKDFFSAVNDMAYEGGFTLSHATMALMILKNNHCNYDTVAYKRELGIQVPKLIDLVNVTGATSNFGIEAIALLYISGNGHLVKPEWLATVISTQMPNGTWNANERTTIFGLWALLEAKRYKTLKP
ncbi:MAG: hypothetical protein M0D57_10150 [Sphingobacteriales bacterium JAD_PAG50586_3]|nr:MAG: hypothetical protein M0D57_10150 [Sphingobacteriales bacterium JAD_PAG50586_3]